MAQYQVIWWIDVDAESPEDAARQALEIQRDNDPANSATVFSVRKIGEDAQLHVIDLAE